MRWLDSITSSMDMNWSKLLETVDERGAWCAAVHEVTVGHNFETEQQTGRKQKKRMKKEKLKK